MEVRDAEDVVVEDGSTLDAENAAVMLVLPVTLPDAELADADELVDPEEAA